MTHFQKYSEKKKKKREVLHFFPTVVPVALTEQEKSVYCSEVNVGFFFLLGSYKRLLFSHP